MSNIIYFASPYGDIDPNVVEKRFQETSKMVANLVSRGFVAISPIVYGHTLLKYQEMPSDWEFWKNFCQSFLLKCEEMIVFKIDGWDRSTGVKGEIEIAEKMGIKISYMKFF